MAVRMGTVGKHREERAGHLGSCEWKRFWRRPLLSMAEENGNFVSAQKTNVWTRWRCRAGAVQAFHPCYKGSIGMQYQQKPEDVHRDLLHQVQERRSIIGNPMQQCGNCVQSLERYKMAGGAVRVCRWRRQV